MYYQQSQLWFHNLVVHTEFGYQTFDACISMRQKSFFFASSEEKDFDDAFFEFRR